LLLSHLGRSIRLGAGDAPSNEGEVAVAARFMWYELQTTDAPAAEGFYKAVVGWTTDKMGEGPLTYTIFNAGKGGVGGMPILDAADVAAGPLWMGYIGVEDVDAHAAKVTAAGGVIHIPPTDIPGVGRFAMATDPQGAAFTLFKGNLPEGPPTGAAGEPGYIGWHELATTDPKAGFGFYAGLFGWKALDALEMGGAGPYQMFSEGGDQAEGGVMKAPADAKRPLWSHYFNVDSIAAAVERARAAGGRITNGPHEVPGGQWIAQGLDPQGAMFSLVGPKG
jgi:predicted enzyme related to lactoylglutathione lyase